MEGINVTVSCAAMQQSVRQNVESPRSADQVVVRLSDLRLDDM